MIKSIRAIPIHLRQGHDFGYPICCVCWFSFVWHPIFDLWHRYTVWRCRYVDRGIGWSFLKGIFRGDGPGYVECPLHRVIRFPRRFIQGIDDGHYEYD